MLKPNDILRRERERRGWSQQKIAQELDTTAKNVSRWERGETVPSPYFRERLCQLFGMDAQTLGLLSASPLSSDNSSPSYERTAILDPALPRLSLPVAHIVGREQLVTEILTHLQTGEDAVLAGLPGIGKTTLAQLVSMHPLRETFFPDGILWICLGPTPNLSSEMLRLATLLHIPEYERIKERSLDAWSCYLHHYIGDRRMLLVIDDAWTIEAIHPFLLGGLHAAHLFTTRLPEVAFAFPTGKIFSVPELDVSQSHTLLMMLVPQLEQSKAEVVQQALATCAGLPLAVTLLGHYVRTQAIGGQRRRLETVLERFTSPRHLHHVTTQTPAPGGTTPRSLKTIIGLSDQYLPPAAQQALRALSVLPAKPDTFSEAAALAVCQQDAAVLDSLLDSGLLEGAGESRYSMHQVIADYARLQQEETSPRLRLVAYGQQVCTSFNVKEAQSLQTVQDEYAVVVLALEAAIALQHTQDVFSMALALVPFWRTQGLYQQAEQWLQVTLAMTMPEQPEYAYLLTHRAEFALVRELWEQAQRDALAGLALTVAPAQQREHTVCLLTLGHVAEHDSNDTQARTYYEEGLQLARLGTDHELTCRLLNGLGNLTAKQGDYPQAVALYQEALALAQQDELLELKCQLLSNLGHTLRLQGDFPHAEQRLREGLALARSLTYRTKQISLLLNLGVILCQQANTVQGKVLLLEGLALARQLEDRRQIKRFLLNLGGIAFEEHLYEEAEHYFQEALDEARQASDITLCIVLLTNLGSVHAKKGFLQQAQVAFGESLQLAHELGDPWLLSNTLVCRAEVFLANQQWDDAERGFQEALAVYQDCDQNRELVTISLFGLAQVMAHRGWKEEARQQAEQCLLTFVEMNHYYAQKVQAWLDQLFPTVVKIEEVMANQQEGT